MLCLDNPRRFLQDYRLQIFIFLKFRQSVVFISVFKFFGNFWVALHDLFCHTVDEIPVERCHGIFLVTFSHVWHCVNSCPQWVFVEVQRYLVVTLAFMVDVEIIFLHGVRFCGERIGLCQINFSAQNRHLVLLGVAETVSYC